MTWSRALEEDGGLFGDVMVKHLKIVAYLITRLAKKGNPNLKFNYLGDSIGWGFVFVNLWVSIVIYELIFETFSPGFISRHTYGKICNPIIVTVVFFMIIEYFIFFSKDQWKQFIPAIEGMDKEERRKLCWRVIWFLIVTVPLTIILLVIKNPMLITWKS